MNKTLLVGILSLLILASCKNNKEEKTLNEDENEIEKDRKTYSELSIKVDGQWVDSKYEGGRFKNVTESNIADNHTDHSGYLRYEGPGWENSQVGYRLYLDSRNAIDIFGKKVDTMVLANIGHPNSVSYHEEAPWGMDILKAGKSLGLGGFGRYIDDSIVHFRDVENTFVKINNSDSFSKVEVHYSGWMTGNKTIDLSATFTIYPDDRFTKVHLSPSDEISGISTGLVKFENIPLLQMKSENGVWGCIASYGNQSLAGGDDNLGMAIFYKISEVQKTFAGIHNHLIVFKPISSINYYFLSAWEQEKNGLTSKQAFVKDLNTKLQSLEKNGEL